MTGKSMVHLQRQPHVSNVNVPVVRRPTCPAKKKILAIDHPSIWEIFAKTSRRSLEEMTCMSAVFWRRILPASFPNATDEGHEATHVLLLQMLAS